MADKKTYFNNLDATRFISFLFIFISHVFYTNNPAIGTSGIYSFFSNTLHLGAIGLDYFFVLSGFLISWIILEEYQQTSHFNIGFFWIRRSLRIWPLYFFIAFLGYILVWMNQHILDNSSEALPPIIYFVFFIVNFYIIHHGQNFLFFLVFLWSISVEEQFYFIWALLMKYLKKYFLLLCFSLIALSVFFRILHINDPTSLYFNTLSTLGNFALGGLTAYLSFHKTKIFHSITNLSKNTILFIYLLLLLNIIFHNFIYSNPFFIALEKIIYSTFFSLIIIEQSFSDHSIFKLGKYSKINYLGRISYGLYCYHGVVITIIITLANKYNLCDGFAEVFFINPLIIFMFTVVLSIISYELVEKKILRFKNKFYPDRFR